ncbi:hypothetical protein GCM10027290_32170 [Micromonospora sonneratiae]|uniref:SixA phosphatase family protein n=1 Tax=Micromonospora sonneratiae TaxID=1184706 RepID=A0ABW3YD95_9ACTN
MTERLEPGDKIEHPPSAEHAVVLLRHAQAGQAPGLLDFERQLTARGKADAFAAGEWLAKQGYAPTAVICSPARRTRQTWHGVALGLAGVTPPDTQTGASGSTSSTPDAPDVRYEPVIYQSRAEELLELLRTVDSGPGTLLLIGHNPSISQLSYLLDPARPGSDGLGTSEMVVHRVPGGWSDLASGGAPVIDRHPTTLA